MNQYKESVKKVINDKPKQDKLINTLLSTIDEGGYTGVVVFCGNFLLGINNRGECVPCVPESFIKDGKVIDQDSFDLCQHMSNKNFDTKFSLFSLQIGLALFSQISIEKQLLLSDDDKYVKNEVAIDYLKQGYSAIPYPYRYELEKCLGGEEKVKIHLSNITSILYDRQGGKGKYNDYLVSERFLVRRFEKRKQTISFPSYKQYYNDLGKGFTSCSLELFHLLTLIREQKINIFESCKSTDKILLLMFIPDACVSSAMQSGLAVSRISNDFDVVNVTQTTSIEDGVIMITKITKDGAVRI